MLRLIKIAAVTALSLVVIASIALYLFLQSNLFDQWVRNQIVSFLENRFAVSVQLESVDVRLFSQEVDLNKLAIFSTAQPREEPAIAIEHIALDFSVRSLWEPSVSLDSLLLVRPEIRLVEDPNDKLNLSNMFFQKKEEDGGGGFSFVDLAISYTRIQDGLILYQDQPILVDSEQGDFQARFRFLPDQREYAGTLELTDFLLRVNGFSLPTATLVTDFAVGENHVELPNVRLTSQAVDAHLSGSISNLREFHYAFDVDLESRLTELTEPSFDFIEEGVVQATGRVAGEKGDFQFEGNATSDTLRVFSLPFRQMTTAFRLDKNQVEISSLRLLLYQGRTQASGVLYWDEAEQSHFTVSSQGIQVAPLLQQYAPELVRLEGRARFEGDVQWPGLAFASIQGEGLTRYSGDFLPKEGELSDDARIPFAGEVDTRLGDGRIELSDGQVQTNASDIRYQGEITFEPIYSFQFTVRSQRGEELIQMADNAGFLPKEILSQYPVQLAGPVSIDAQLDNREGVLQLAGDLVSRNIHLHDFRLGDFSTEFRYASDQLTLSNARLQGEGFHLTTDLDLPLGDAPLTSVSFDIEAADLPIAPLIETATGKEVPVSGQLTAKLRLTREDSAAISGGGEFRISDLEAYGTSLGDITGELTAMEDQVQVSNLQAGLYDGSISGELAYNLSSKQFSADLTGHSINLTQVEPIQERAEVSGLLEFKLDSSGTLEDPEGTVQATISELGFRDYPLQDLSFEGKVDNQLLDFSLRHVLEGREFLISGETRLESPYETSASMELDSVPLAPYLALFVEDSVPDIEGTISGIVRAKGPAASPTEMTGEVELSELAVELVDYSIGLAEPATIHYQDGQLRLSAVRLSGTETDLVISGTAGLREGGDLDLEVEGNINLSLATGLMEEGSASGQLELQINTLGTFEQPRLVGTAVLQEGFLIHPAIPTSLFNIEGEIKFTTNQVAIDNISLRTQFGQLNAEGGIFLAGLEPTRWQINMFGSGLRFNYPEGVTSIIDLDLDFLRSEQSQLLSGVVYVRSAEYMQQVTIPELLLSYSRSQAVPSPDQGQEIVLDIDVEAYRSLRVSNNLADIFASGDFTVRGTVQNPVIVGNMTIDSGQLYFENNTYEIIRGNVTFNNPRRTNPVFNFEATTDVAEYTVTLLVRGPLDQLNVNFSSDPPLPTASVVSLLVTGQTQEQIFGSEATGPTMSSSLAVFGAGSVLAKTLGEQLEARTSRLFGFEKFSIDPFIGGDQRDPGARFTLGKQLTSDLGVTYVTSLGNQFRRQTIVIEYDLTDWLTAVGTGQDDGALAIDFKFRKRF